MLSAPSTMLPYHLLRTHAALQGRKDLSRLCLGGRAGNARPIGGSWGVLNSGSLFDS